MGIIDILLIGIGLSMDAFAVAICKGLKMKTINFKQCFLIALFFGGFQAIMPLVGWILGIQFQKHIEAFDHWIAFGLLVCIGANMIRESFLSEDSDTLETAEINVKELTLMATATSIDALAVGIAFASLGNGLRIGIITAVLLIGITTFAISVCGVFIGNAFGTKYKKKAEIAGGVILILIGTKILLEHLGIL